MNLKDCVVVVTGAGSGIGAALASRFARDGARAVIVADRDEVGANRVADALGADGRCVEARRVDVAVESEIKALVDDVVARHGRIDLFCSNAGVIASGGAEASDAAWDLSWSVNVMAHVYAARAVLPHMLERGEGYILNTASSAGLLTALGAAPYTVTKHAAVAFAEWLAITYGDRGIKVSLLCPQAVQTAMLDAAMSGSAANAVKSAGAVLTPEDVATQVSEALAEERFLILTHPEISTYVQRKATDTDRWIAGMRRFAAFQGD